LLLVAESDAQPVTCAYQTLAQTSEDGIGEGISKRPITTGASSGVCDNIMYVENMETEKNINLKK